MVDTVPSVSVKKVRTGLIVLAPALPLVCCVILGLFLPYSGPESPHAPSNLWGTTEKPEMLERRGPGDKRQPVFRLRTCHLSLRRYPEIQPY